MKKASENYALDRVLKSDAILVDSLHKEEQKRRRIWKVSLVGGMMTCALILSGVIFTQTGLAAAADALAAEGWKLWQEQRMVEAE